MTKLLFLTLVLIFTLTACQSKTDRPPAQSNAAIAVEDPKTAGLKKIYWTCPMHPQIHKDGPGQCPICGMTLVKAGGEEVTLGTELEKSHADFHLNSARSQMIGVKFQTVEKKELVQFVEAAGRVAFDPELFTAQTEYVEAARQLERVQNSPIEDVKRSTQKMLDSAKLRLKILGLSDSQIRNLRAESGSNLLIPKPGEQLWVYAEVFEMDLPSVHPGATAVLRGGILGGEEIHGTVVSVDRVINPSSRTARVRIQVPDVKGVLKPEAFVNVTILNPLGVQTIVPFDAVFDTGKHSWVFITDGKGHFEPRAVTIRFRAGDDLAVGSGIKEGEQIVTSSNFLIDSESRLKAAAREMAAEDKKIQCPSGQFWHAEMKHCMPIPAGQSDTEKSNVEKTDAQQKKDSP